VAPLTPADVKRWDADAIHGVFQTATNRAATLQTLGDNLQQVHSNLSDWRGEAGDAFRADLGKTRRDIEADGQESKQVAAAVLQAEADVRAVKSELEGIEQTAEGYGFTITPDWRIEAGMGAIGFDKLTLAAEEQLLQGQLTNCKVHAHNADQELANAVRGAVGEAPALPGTSAPGAAPPGPNAPGGTPKSRRDMLLPAGPISAEPGRAPAKGPPVAAGASTGKPPSLEDMMLGRGQPADQKPPPGSPLDLLSRVQPPAVPPQRLNPADVENFKAMARQTMISDGVPPDQIEAKLNDVVARTQQYMDAGMPKYSPPDPPRPPPPGFGDGFGDRWNSTVDGVQNLSGENGLDAMGDAWGGMAKGLGQKAEEYLTLGPVAPIADAAGEVRSFIDNPAYYAGGKAADGAFALPGMMFGPEGAGVGELGGADAAAAAARDLPGVHPPLSPLEQILPDLHSPLAPPEVPPHEEFHPSGPAEGPTTGLFGPPGPPEGPLSAGHVPALAEVPVAAGHAPIPAEAHAPTGHAPSGPPEPPVSGGHGESGPHEPPVSGGHPPDGPPNHLPVGPIDNNPPHIPPESQWAPIGHDQPITYHPEASQAALDLSDAYAHHQPTAALSQRVADMSTHYVGDNPDRVVLGKWNGDDSGYIGDARRHGGIYYDTSTEVWDNIGHGLSKTEGNDLGWEVNESFLRRQMERGIERIDYVVEGTKFTSVEDVLRYDPESFSAREIRFMTENASSYGYERIGDSWVRVKGGRP
jgi:hypothetical protein